MVRYATVQFVSLPVVNGIVGIMRRSCDGVTWDSWVARADGSAVPIRIGYAEPDARKVYASTQRAQRLAHKGFGAAAVRMLAWNADTTRSTGKVYQTMIGQMTLGEPSYFAVRPLVPFMAPIDTFPALGVEYRSPFI